MKAAPLHAPRKNYLPSDAEAIRLARGETTAPIALRSHLIALPPHGACKGDGCGEVLPDMSAVCVVRRTFKATQWREGKAVAWDPVDAPGCGERSILNAATGVREFTP